MPEYAVGYTYRIHAYEQMEAKSYNSNATTTTDLQRDGWRPLVNNAAFNTVKSTHDVLYRISFYRGATMLTQDDALVEISIDGGSTDSSADDSEFNIWKDSEGVKKVASIPMSRGISTFFAGGYFIRTIDDRYFDFTVKPNGKNGQLPSPKFKAQIKFKVADAVNGGVGITREVQREQGAAYYMPIINFTKSSTPKDVPPEVASDVEAYAWNNCTDRWVRYTSTPVTVFIAAGSPAVNYWQSSVRYFDKWGIEIKPAKMYGKAETAEQMYKKGSGAEQAKAEVAAAGVCVKGSDNDPDLTPPPVVDPTLKPVVVTGILFNPPPHISTRHHSPIAYDRK